MKIGYEKPTFIVEEYELDTAIASGCGQTLSLGPEDGNGPSGQFYTACREFEEETFDAEGPTHMSFFEGKCSCYLSSAGATVFTS